MSTNLCIFGKLVVRRGKAGLPIDLRDKGLRWRG